MFCHNCGVQLEDNAKFCPECGAKVADSIVDVAPTRLNRTTATDSIASANNTEEVQLWKKPISLLIFPAVWVVFHVVFVNGFVSVNTIAEGIGGAIMVLVLPLIVTSITYFIKSSQGTSYPNFIYHSFIGTGIMLVLAIMSVFND